MGLCEELGHRRRARRAEARERAELRAARIGAPSAARGSHRHDPDRSRRARRRARSSRGQGASAWQPRSIFLPRRPERTSRSRRSSLAGSDARPTSALVEPLHDGDLRRRRRATLAPGDVPQPARARARARQRDPRPRGASGGEREARYPPFVALGVRDAGARRRVWPSVFGRTRCLTGRAALGVRRGDRGYEVELDDGERLDADGVVVAVPAFAAAELLAELDPDLAAAHAEIPYASSAVVTLAYRTEDVARPLDGYGYVVPRAEGSDVLACSWTSSKWEGRAPEGSMLVRVFAGRFGGRDVTADSDEELVALARNELQLLEIDAEPAAVPRPPLAARDAPVRPRSSRAARADRRSAHRSRRARTRRSRLSGSRHPRLHPLRRGSRALARAVARAAFPDDAGDIRAALRRGSSS